MDQGSNEWLETRKEKITSTDAPVIMRDSPWKTAYQLWEEKLGIREIQRKNIWMARGIEMEPIARTAFESYVGKKFDPLVAFHPSCDWLMASLDGVSSDKKSAVEIKCPGEKDHEIAKKGKVPKKYFAQLQHQMAVLDIDMIFYFSYTDKDFYTVEVERDELYVLSMIEAEFDFWQKVKLFECPDLTDKDYYFRDDGEWLEAVQEWRLASSKLQEIKKDEAVSRKRLLQLSENRSTEGGGVRVQKILRKGSVDYGRIPELESIDLDKFRKDPSECWRIILKKGV